MISDLFLYYKVIVACSIASYCDGVLILLTECIYKVSTRLFFIKYIHIIVKLPNLEITKQYHTEDINAVFS